MVSEIIWSCLINERGHEIGKVLVHSLTVTAAKLSNYLGIWLNMLSEFIGQNVFFTVLLNAYLIFSFTNLKAHYAFFFFYFSNKMSS